MAKGRKRKKGSARARKGCSAAGITARGTLRKGFRWAKGRKRCAVKARRRGRARRRR